MNTLADFSPINRRFLATRTLESGEVEKLFVIAEDVIDARLVAMDKTLHHSEIEFTFEEVS